jgi:hypothetical protein
MIGLAMMLAAADLPMRFGSGYTTGEMLDHACRQRDRTACLEYITGAADTLSYLESTDNMLRAVCLPRDLTKAGLADVVVAYLSKRPEQKHMLAGSVVFGALYAAFPCPKDEIERGLGNTPK